MVSLIVLEDDGKAYSKTDKGIRQHAFLSVKKAERSQSFPRPFRITCDCKMEKLQKGTDFL